MKYPRIEFKTEGLLFILPFGYDPKQLWNKHRRWIQKKIEFVDECGRKASSKEIAKRSETEFKELVHVLIEGTSKELGVRLNNLYFRKMKTKWASCSPKGNLMINRLMRSLPGHLIAYIIFHEMVHLKEKRHNDKFWEIVSKKFKNFQEMERDLFVYWFKIAMKTI